jgi:PAS domain S-box-containing protein
MSEFRVDDLNPRGGDELLESFFADAAVGLSITDLQGRFVKVNPAYCALTGYTEAELHARDFQSITHPDDLPRMLAKVQSLLSGEISSFLIEKRYIRKDAIIVWVLNSVSVLRDKHGQPLNLVKSSQDISERMGLEESLRQAQAHTESILSSITDTHLLFDRHWHFLYVNDAAVRAIGCPREQIIGQILWDLYPDLVETEMGRQYRRAMDERVTVTFEFHYERPNTWWDTRFYPVPTGLAVFATDITERKRSEEELRESEERFSKAFYSSPALLIITRLVDGCFLDANDSFLSAFEYERDEVIGKTVHDLNIYVEHPDRKKLIEELREQGALRGYESRARTKSGRILDLLVSVEPIKLKGEQCILSTAHDITERKSIEEALRESEERYRELFENAKDALYVHDLGGRYTSFNRAAEQLSGFSREEILGKHFSNFVAPASLRYVRENLCKKLDDEGETTYEIDLITKDRRRVPVEVSSRLIYENGKPVGVQGVARDMTERKRAQEALRTYSQRLIEAQEAERQVIARELHDEIGQVLTAVRINLQSLQHSTQNDSQSSIDDSLVIVDEALDRVRELSLNLRPSVLDNLGLSSALRWYVDRCAQRSGIVADLQSDLEDGRRLGVELETACFRIVQEALTNVVRHARATRVLVRLKRSNGNLSIKVTDNGVGFDLAGLIKNSPPAWNLGLRGMEERAVAAQGRLKIDSAPMRGTEISVSFPLKEEG